MQQAHINSMTVKLRQDLPQLLGITAEVISRSLTEYWKGCLVRIYTPDEILAMVRDLKLNLNSIETELLLRDLMKWYATVKPEFTRQNIKDFLQQWYKENVLSKLALVNANNQPQGLLIIKLKEHENNVLYAALLRAYMPWDECETNYYTTAFGKLVFYSRYNCSFELFTNNLNSSIYTGVPYCNEMLIKDNFEKLEEVLRQIRVTGKYTPQ